NGREKATPPSPPTAKTATTGAVYKGSVQVPEVDETTEVPSDATPKSDADGEAEAEPVAAPAAAAAAAGAEAEAGAEGAEAEVPQELQAMRAPRLSQPTPSQAPLPLPMLPPARGASGDALPPPPPPLLDKEGSGLSRTGKSSTTNP
ncbi:unnamed protein product, partial [Laminaria digitata]